MLYFWIVVVFLVGAAVGSFLNVCAARLPYEKSLFWPGSRCGSCFQPIRWYDNIPLLSYWTLGGRCRTCGATFSARYFWVELTTALVFVGLFYLEVVVNVLDLPLVRREAANIAVGFIVPELWWVVGYHALLVSFLLAASICDLEHMEIPLSITMTGTFVGLIGSMIFPWPYPEAAALAQANLQPQAPITPGLYPWPVWTNLPDWLLAGSWQLGLATGLAGAAMGMLVLRVIRYLFGLGRGIEGLGAGDADLMMMAGAFVGWQPILIAFFVSVAPGLLFGILRLVLRGNEEMPFGPSLALGVVLTLGLWSKIGANYRFLLTNGELLAILAGLGAVLLLIISFLLRLVRGKPEPEK